jgi:hypothetical protein
MWRGAAFVRPGPDPPVIIVIGRGGRRVVGVEQHRAARSAWGDLRADDNIAGSGNVFPAGACALDRADRRLDDHEVHELPVDELLQWERPQRSHRLAVEPERVHGDRQLQNVKRAPDDQRVHGAGEQQTV